jgi:hypothetical protein
MLRSMRLGYHYQEKQEKHTPPSKLNFLSDATPVSLIQEDNFVASWWQCDFLLCKHLDFVAHHIYTSTQQIGNAPHLPTSVLVSLTYT